MNWCLSNGIKPNNGINYFVINLLTIGIFTSGVGFQVSVNSSGGPKTSSYHFKNEVSDLEKPNNNYFGKDWSPQKRCTEVSKRFQTIYERNKLIN